jgi:hypothetical protein
MVTIKHIREEGFCASGARDWFASHDLSWATLVSEGYPVEVIEATKDSLATRVAKRARAEAAST